MFKKKLASVVLLMTLVLSLGGSAAVAAGNYADTKWSFEMPAQNSTRATPGRSKLDSTSSYMKCTAATTGKKYDARVVARNSVSGTLLDAGGTTYRFGAGTVKYMTNYVKERGYPYASIFLIPVSGNTPASFSGVWSPDSI